MNNPLSFIASAGVPSSLKIDKASLHQQMMKRYESIAAQKAKQNVGMDQTKSQTPKLVILKLSIIIKIFNYPF
jgi:hypothetical protein